MGVRAPLQDELKLNCRKVVGVLSPDMSKAFDSSTLDEKIANISFL